MTVRLRLKRLGKKKKPFYRLVVADSRSPRDGKDIENVGTYDPTKEPVHFAVKKDRVKYWLSVGAQPSETVQRLLASIELVPAVKKVPTHPGVSKKQKKEQQEG